MEQSVDGFESEEGRCSSGNEACKLQQGDHCEQHTLTTQAKGRGKAGEGMVQIQTWNLVLPHSQQTEKKKSASAEISRPCQQIVQNSGWLPHPNKQKQRLHSKTHTSHPHTLSLTHPLPQRHLVSLAPLSRLARCCLLRGLREWLEWHARPQLAPCRGMVQAPWPPGAATPPQAKRRQMP